MVNRQHEDNKDPSIAVVVVFVVVGGDCCRNAAAGAVGQALLPLPRLLKPSLLRAHQALGLGKRSSGKEFWRLQA